MCIEPLQNTIVLTHFPYNIIDTTILFNYIIFIQGTIMRFLTTLFIASLACMSAVADTLGAAWVTDGDTFKDAETVRIPGLMPLNPSKHAHEMALNMLAGKTLYFSS